MIAVAKSIGHGAEGINYALDKENSEVIDKRYVVGENGKEIKNEFKAFQNLNHRCEKNDISFVISPEPKDGSKLTNNDFKAISDDFLKKMNLEKHQAIVVKHVDKKHTHLHIFVNRIDSNGKAYKDNFISKKSQTIADEIAKERGLTRASVVQEFNKEMTKDLRNQIHLKHKAVLEHSPKDFKTYSELMKSSGVDILPTINKQGNLQGYRLKFQGQDFKASEVHRSMTLPKMGVNQNLSKNLNVASNLNPALKIGFKIAKIITKGMSGGIGI